MQKSCSYLRHMYNRKGHFWGEGCLNGLCLGHLMDLARDAPAILRCAEAMHVHQTQPVSKFAKKSVPRLIDPLRTAGGDISAFRSDFCDNSQCNCTKDNNYKLCSVWFKTLLFVYSRFNRSHYCSHRSWCYDVCPQILWTSLQTTPPKKAMAEQDGGGI